MGDAIFQTEVRAFRLISNFLPVLFRYVLLGHGHMSSFAGRTFRNGELLCVTRSESVADVRRRPRTRAEKTGLYLRNNISGRGSFYEARHLTSDQLSRCWKLMFTLSFYPRICTSFAWKSRHVPGAVIEGFKNNFLFRFVQAFLSWIALLTSYRDENPWTRRRDAGVLVVGCQSGNTKAPSFLMRWTLQKRLEATIISTAVQQYAILFSWAWKWLQLLDCALMLKRQQSMSINPICSPSWSSISGKSVEHQKNWNWYDGYS